MDVIQNIAYYALMGWLMIGFSWFSFIMASCVWSKRRMVPGSLLGCAFGWPITMYGYIQYRRTGKWNQYLPFVEGE